MALEPPSPNDFKDLIASPTGNFCDKMAKVLIQMPLRMYQFVSWMFTEAATPTPTDEFTQFICTIASGCSGASGPINPSMPAPSPISASDGSFSDKVTITWGAVTPPIGIPAVTQYKVYRALATITDPAQATLLATVTAPTVTYDDTTAVQGTVYNYWVVATNGTNTSNYGGPDPGSAGAPSATLPAVSDLRASQGFSRDTGGSLALVWTPVTGAERYDIWRGTTNVFADATKVISNQIPTSTDTPHFTMTMGVIYDNTENLTYRELPPAGDAKFYYWVVARKDSPPAYSPESNAAQGWVMIGTDETVVDKQVFVSPLVIPGGITRIRMTVFGIGGGGAGGGEVYGGGGGGAGPIASLQFTVAPGDTITQVNTPPSGDSGNAAAMSNGASGPTTAIKLNGVTVATLTGGSGGVYSASGGGGGGAIGTASGTVVLTAWNGIAGKAGSGVHGGKSGAGFGFIRQVEAWYGNVFTGGWEGLGVAGNGGSGAHAQVGVPGGPDSVGGKATQSSAVYATFAS